MKTAENSSNPKPEGLNSNLYDEAYYEHSLPGLEHTRNSELLDEAAPDTIEIGKIQPGQRILDYGCGRGALSIHLAKLGCDVVGADFSPHAIQFANQLKSDFESDIQNRVSFFVQKIEDITDVDVYDVIVFNQIYEHLHDWELEAALDKFKGALKPGGALIISTPNWNYENLLFPLKRIVNLPFKLLKEIGRVLRKKSKHSASFGAFVKEVFKIRYPESEHTQLHINLQTPMSIKRFLENQGFRVDVRCIDRHKNLLSRLLKNSCGETIWVNAQMADVSSGE